jgi:hypothetical protein
LCIGCGRAWRRRRARGGRPSDARAALHYVAPVGEKDAFVARAMGNIEPFLPQ